MKLSKKLPAWRESIQRYAIPLVIVAILIILVTVLYEGRLTNIQRLLAPSEKIEEEKKAEEPLKKPSYLPPAGIELPPAITESPRKPSPDAPVASGEIDQYLALLARQQAEEKFAESRGLPTPPAGPEKAAAPAPTPPSVARPSTEKLLPSPPSPSRIEGQETAAAPSIPEKLLHAPPHVSPPPSEQKEPGLIRWVRKSPTVQTGEGGDLIIRKEIGPPAVPVIKFPALPMEKRLIGGSDLLITPEQEVWVKGKKIPIGEMIRILKEKRPAADSDLFGLRIVRPGDNIWNIHFEVIKAFFWNQRGIRLPSLIDEPDERGHSSGIGKILKFGETIGVSYNLITGKITRDPDFLRPGQEIYFFRMKDILSVLEGVSVADLNKFKYDGKELYYLGQRAETEKRPPSAEMKAMEIR